MTQVRLMVDPRSTCKSGEPWIRTCGTVTGYIGFFTKELFEDGWTRKSLWLRCMRNMGQLWYWDLGDRIMESGLSISKTWSNFMVYDKISLTQSSSSWPSWFLRNDKFIQSLGLDLFDPLKPFHRLTNGPWPSKTIETNGWTTPKPLKNHQCQWSANQKTINGDGVLQNHWKFSMVSSKPLKFSMVSSKSLEMSIVNILYRKLKLLVVTITHLNLL